VTTSLNALTVAGGGSVNGSTIDMANMYATTCGGNGNEAVFSYVLPAGQTLRLWQSQNSYDSRHETRWGGDCPGDNVVQCTDDPDTLEHAWHNDQGVATTVYFILDSFSSGSGEFTLSWAVEDNWGVEEGEVRLAGGASASAGRVEVFHSGEWGSVCDDGFGAAEADVVCRQLGFEGAQNVNCCAEYGEASGAIWLGACARARVRHCRCCSLPPLLALPLR